MPVHPMSLFAWKEIQETLSPKRQKVFNCIIEHGPMTDVQIADRLNWPINQVTGRRGELVNFGHVQSSGIFINKDTRKPNTIWSGVLWPTVEKESA